MSKFKTIKVTIDKAHSNKRLDQALTNILDKYSRSQIKILLQNKNVKTSNEIISNLSYKVKEGEVFYINFPQKNEIDLIPQEIPINIVYEDKDIIVVNKPAGMVTHPAAGNKDKTLVNALLYYKKNSLSSINNDDRPGIVHSLDKDTSGLLVIAKNNLAHLDLAKQFKEHSIKRKYYAIVWGIPENQIIKGFIKRHKINRKKMILSNFNNGKYSETSIKIKKAFNICSLIECSLKTGRTHQVRVHMNSIQHPLIGDKIYNSNKVSKYAKGNKNINKFQILKNFQLVGDKLYGKKNIKKYGKYKENFNIFLTLKNFSRQALHAYSIGFNHPISKKRLEFKSKIPDDMLNLLDYISKY